MIKQCFKCKKSKELKEFYKHPQMPDGHVNKCKECNKLDVRVSYANNREKRLNYDKFRHRHSIIRLFNHKYSMIKGRCTKVRNSNGKPYKVFGTDYLSKEEWLYWCYEKENYKKFMKIYNSWVQSDYNQKLTPSIDRIDNKIGYISSNLQWLTLSQNCKKHSK